MCLSSSAVVTAKVFIFKLGSDKRVLVCVFMSVVYGTYWQVSRGQVERKEHFGLIPAALMTPIITIALNTKHGNANTDEVKGSCWSK